MRDKEFFWTAIGIALCVCLCFFLLVWLFQHLDPNVGGWVK